jgi:lysophospholipase L1-like esterase
MAHAQRQPWSVAPSLGAFAAASLAAALLLDGGVRAIRHLPIERPAPPPSAPTAPSQADGAPPVAEAPPPPLPPRPDLAPERAPGGKPLSIAGKTVEDFCVEPLGAADACRRWSLDGFYAALAASEAGRAPRATRVSWYGDSVSAADAVPGRLRARLQDVFGDGGPGFVHAVAPHRFNHNLAVARSASGSWKSWGVSLANIGDDLYGVGNATAEGHGTIKLSAKTPTGKLSAVEVYYLAQPGGGTAELVVDGEVKASLDTAAEKKQARFAAVALADAEHKLELRSLGKVRLFGFTLERAAGVVVDNMALVSANAKNMLNNRADHWTSQLAHREADLIVIMIGTNEAQWLSGSDRAMAEYLETWRKLLAPVRAARPQASCLVVSPLDQAEVKDDKLVPRRGLPAMVATQRAAAQALGCGFWDTFTWMGGSGAAIKWNRRGLLGSDFAHMSGKGSAQVADGLADALIAGYKAYKGR